MEWHEFAMQFGFLIVGVAASFLTIVVGLPVYLYHRRQMLKLKGNNARDVKNLHNRIDELEERCKKLEEQVTDAHCLIADEQRELDRKLERKLSAIVPDPIDPGEPTEPPEPEKSGRHKNDRGRVRQ
jgi:hypothetical protein